MAITKELLAKLEQEYTAAAGNETIAPAVARVGLEEAAFNQDSRRRHTFQFSDKTKQGEVTNQKQSGRCWLFAALNTARIEAMKKYDIESLEFSQTYLFFWDTLERST